MKLYAFSKQEFDKFAANEEIFESVFITDEAVVISITENENEHYFRQAKNVLNVEFLDDDSLCLEKALDIVKFIHDNIHKDFYIHCSAGKSRSQAIVRYILDCYPQYEWETREDNPCDTPNYHVVQQLKKCHRFLYE